MKTDFKGMFHKIVSMTVSVALILSSTNISVFALNPTGGVLDSTGSSQQYENSTKTIGLLNALSDFIIENGVLTKYIGTGSDVIIPDSVISIANNAFSGSNSITTITIPDGVTNIGNRAFQGCGNLISVTIGSGVSTVGEAPFMYCLKLQEIKVSSSNPSITALEGVLFNKDMTKLLAFPNGKAGSYTIPQGVEILANRAFCWSTEITSLKIPDSITTLEYYSIALCEKLSFVEFDGECAGLTSIGNVFYGSNNLEILTITKNVSSIDAGQFANNTKLYHIKIHTANQHFSVEDEILFNKEKSKMILSNKTISGEYHVPISVTEIQPAAFFNCTLLTDIYIPSQTTKIGDINAYHSVFGNYSNLTIHGEDGSAAQQYARDNNIPFASDNGTGNALVTGIEIGQVVAEALVGQNLQLTAIISPENATDKSVTWESSNATVAAVDGNGLVKCVGTGEVIITVRSKDGGFTASHTLTVSINDDFVIVDGVLTEYTGHEENVVIPYGITSIGSRAFQYYYPLRSVTIPNTVVSIGTRAFDACYSLNSVIIPNSVKSIGDEAFYCCSSLISVAIPNSVTSIGERVFYDCSSLIIINVGSENTAYSSVDGILYNKFKTTLVCYPMGKTSSSFNVPVSVTSIGSYAFSYTKLTSIIIPNGVTSISRGAFECSSLTSVDIPGSVTSIGDMAFRSSSLTSVIIPESVTSIGNYTFFSCYNLERVTIPDSITSIGDAAFASCTRLTSVTIPKSVTSIGIAAFSSCTRLTSVTIPDSVTSIGSSAFNYCPNLTLYGFTGSYAESFAQQNSIPFLSIDVKDNPFSYGYIPPKIIIPNDSVNEITDINHDEPKPFANNTVTLPINEVTNRPGDFKVINTKVEIEGGSLSYSGDIIVEQGTLKVTRGSTVSARHIKIGTGGVLIVEGKIYTDSLDMYGGSSSDALGGQLIISGSAEYPSTGALECNYLNIKDYAKLTLWSKANLIADESITIQNKIKNDLTSGNIWAGGDFIQKNGGWFNQGADNFQAGSNLSVILYVSRVLNRVKEHRLEFQSRDKSWLNNLYIVDTLWNELENNTRSFNKKNVTIKGKSALVHKHANTWNFSLITHNNKKMEIESTVRATIAKMKAEVSIITYGIPELGDMNSEGNKAVALVAAALANLHYAKTSATGIYGAYSELNTKIKDKDIVRDVKFFCQGVEMSGATVAQIKYSYNGGITRHNYGVLLKADYNRLYEELYSYATEGYADYKAGIAELFQVPLPDILDWVEKDIQKVLTEYLFKSVYNNVSTSIVELTFPKVEDSYITSLQGFKGNIESNVESIAFNTKLLSQEFKPYTISSSEVMEDNMKEAICEALNVQNFEDITTEDLATITGLDLTNRYITSLTGLEQLVNLETLFMSGNAVRDLSPISNLTKLKELDLSGNNVNSLTPLAGLTNITSLKMANNYCSEISPIENLIKLETLDISNNNLWTLEPLSALTRIETLYISGNALDNKSLDALTGLNSLQALAASRCNVENIQAVANKPLLFVDLSFNSIVDISKLNSEILQTANLSGNLISDISTLGQMSDLIHLDFSDNNVSILEGISSLSNLRSLYLSNNPIVDITEIGGLSQIEKLDCGNVQVSDFGPLASLCNLKELSICNTKLADLSFLAGKDNLQKLALSNCYLDDISTEALSALTSLQHVDLSFNFISNLSPLSTLIKLKNLNLDNNNLSDSPSNQIIIADISSRGGNVSMKTKNVVLYDIFLSDEITVSIGQTEQLTPMIMPLNASNQNVSWTSDNTAVVSVDENGYITAVSAGNAVVTVTTQEGGYSASCVVTVPIPAIYTVNITAANGTVTGNASSYTLGQVVTLTAAPAEGYIFHSWADKTGTVLSINQTYSFNITDNVELIANFVDKCDINKDGEVSILDLAAIARNYNTRNTAANWNSIFDLNKDDIIDIFDLVICSKRIN